MATALENELTGTIALLERDLPGNPASPRNVRLANTLENDLRKYFEQLSATIPEAQIDALYYKYVRQD